jgi:hypothetical protein
MSKRPRLALALSLLLTQAGCSTGNTAPALGSGTSSDRAESASAIPARVFVGEDGDHDTLVLNTNGKQLGSIRGKIGIMAADNEGNLYIAGVPNRGDVSVFAPPYRTRQILQVSTSEQVGAVAVDPKTDILVATTLSDPESGPPEAVFYRHNRRSQRTPCNTLLLSNLDQGGFKAAFDANGRVFMIAGLGNGEIGIASISGECSATGDVQYSFKNPPRLNTVAIAVDGENHVVVAWSNGDDETLLTYQNPTGNQFGSPIATTILEYVNGLTPVFLGLSSDGKYLWAGTCCDVPTQFLGLYKYPGGKNPVKTYSGIKDANLGAIYPQLIP